MQLTKVSQTFLCLMITLFTFGSSDFTDIQQLSKVSIEREDCYYRLFICKVLEVDTWIHVCNDKELFWNRKKIYITDRLLDFVKKDKRFKHRTNYDFRIVFSEDSCGMHYNAMSRFDEKNEIAYIIFNKRAAKTMTALQLQFVLAHEIGHYMCKHYLNPYPSTKEHNDYEENADYLAGLILGHFKNHRLQKNLPELKARMMQEIKELYTLGIKGVNPSTDKVTFFSKGFDAAITCKD